MPQPHITHETYKGLTPDEQAKYGEEVWLERIIWGGDWLTVHQITMADYNEDFDDFTKDRDADVETMRIHYLKPVEAQQSEVESHEQIIQRATRNIDLNRFSVYEALQMGLTLGINHTSATYHPQLTALQQDVERLKAELETLRNTLFQTLRESTIHGYTYCQHIVDKVLPPTK